jgi:peptidoglycan/xylan/chitin deacetylase (PgdA/CDA1 family)
MDTHGSTKDRIAAALFALGVLHPFARARRRSLTVFCYHRVRAHATEATLFDAGVYGPTARELQAQLRWLKKYTRVLSLDEFLELAQRPEPPSEPCSLITFDDGYRDNYELALPVLRELVLPAIFFISTQLISERRLGWWDLIAYLVKKTERAQIELGGRCFQLAGRTAAAIAELQHRMKTLPCAETSGLIEELARSTAVALPTAEEQSSQLMSWKQLREAADHGVAIGAHGHSHRVLTTLGDQDVRAELVSSKRMLELQMAAPVHSIAYPCGGKSHYDERTKSIAAACGFLAGFTLNASARSIWPEHRLEINRHSPGATLERFAGLVAMPRLFAWRT